MSIFLSLDSYDGSHANLRRVTSIVLVLLIAITMHGCGQQSLDELLDRAQESIESKRYRQAILDLKTALQQNPGHGQARLLLGNVYLNVEDGASAEKEFRNALALGVSEDLVLPGMARALLLNGKAEAVLDLEPTTSLSQQPDAELMAAKALAHLSQNDIEKSQAILQSIQLSDLHWVRWSKVQLLVRQKRLDEALSLLEEILENDPEDGRAWSLLGEIRMVKRQMPEAENAFSKAIQLRGNATRERVLRGYLRLAQQDIDAAVNDAEALLEVSSKSKIVLRYVAMVRLTQGEYLEAKDIMESLYGEDPGDLSIRYLLAYAHYKLGGTSRSQEILEPLLATAPEFIPARVLLGAVYLRQNEGGKTERLLRPVVIEQPDNHEAKNILAAGLAQQGKHQEAAELLLELGSSDEQFAIMQAQAGMNLLAAGDDAEGLALVKKAIEASPMDDNVNSMAVSGLLELGRLNLALEFARANAEKNPQSPQAWTMLGMALASSGETVAAEKAFNKVLVMDANNLQAFYGLANLKFNQGDIQAARQYLQKGLNQNPGNPLLLSRLAQIEVSNNNYSLAEELLQEAILADNSGNAPKLLLARLLIRKGEERQALELLRGVDDNGKPDVLRELSAAFLNMQSYADAQASLEKLAKIEPDNAAMQIELARVYAELGNKPLLRQAFERAYTLAPENPKILQTKVRLLALDKKFTQAEAELSSLEGKVPQATTLLTRLFLERVRGDTAAQLAVLRKLFALKPSTNTILPLAASLAHLDKTPEAEIVLQRWLDQHPEDIRATWALYEIQIGMQNEKKAVATLNAYLQLRPESANAHNNLAWHLRESDPQLALRHAREAWQIAPQSMRVLDTYADVLTRNGEGRRALDLIDDRMDNAGDDKLLLQLRSAEIYHSLGDTERAIETVETVLADAGTGALRDRARSLLLNWRG